MVKMTKRESKILELIEKHGKYSACSYEPMMWKAALKLTDKNLIKAESITKHKVIDGDGTYLNWSEFICIKELK